jgi:hypothetical protein
MQGSVRGQLGNWLSYLDCLAANEGVTFAFLSSVVKNNHENFGKRHKRETIMAFNKAESVQLPQLDESEKRDTIFFNTNDEIKGSVLFFFRTGD